MKKVIFTVIFFILIFLSQQARAFSILHYEGTVTRFLDTNDSLQVDSLVGKVFKGTVEYDQFYVNKNHIYNKSLMGQVSIESFIFDTALDNAFLEENNGNIFYGMLPYNPVAILSQWNSIIWGYGDSSVYFNQNGIGNWDFTIYSILDNSPEVSVSGAILRVYEANPVPEPSTIILFFFGTLFLLIFNYFKKSRNLSIKILSTKMKADE